MSCVRLVTYLLWCGQTHLEVWEGPCFVGPGGLVSVDAQRAQHGGAHRLQRGVVHACELHLRT